MKSNKSIQINPIPSLIFLFVFILAKFMRYCKSLFPAWKMLQLPAFSNHPNFFSHIRYAYAQICYKCTKNFIFPNIKTILQLHYLLNIPQNIFHSFQYNYTPFLWKAFFFIFTWKKSVFKELHYCFLPLFLDDLLPTSAQLNLPAFQPQSYNNYTIIWHWLVFI